jgi:hypothetical protein
MKNKYVYNWRKGVKALLPVLGYLGLVLLMAIIGKEMLLHIMG